jgi:N-acyl-phosphatidylethanolamine-hydrolysing phospholipase D
LSSPSCCARRRISISDDERCNPTFPSLWISCLPVQHWGSRTFFDRNYRLWCSFAVFFQQKHQCTKRFFFGGDSALPTTFPLFQQIRDFVGGSVDLAAIPIGAYEPSFFMREAHMNPEEAVFVHQVLNSRQSVGIHWGTFPLSEEPMKEPPVRLQQALKVAGFVDGSFTTLQVGEAITVDDCGNIPLQHPDLPNIVDSAVS